MLNTEERLVLCEIINEGYPGPAKSDNLWTCGKCGFRHPEIRRLHAHMVDKCNEANKNEKNQG